MVGAAAVTLSGVALSPRVGRSRVAAARAMRGVTRSFEPGHRETGLRREGHYCWQS